MALVKILLPKFEIELERDTVMKRFDFDNNVSFIRGRVLFHPKIRTNLNELVVILEGKLTVDPPDGYKTIERAIIEQKVILSERNDHGVALSPTCHEFSFEIYLPSDLPESFRGDYGSLTYKLRAFGSISDYWSLSSIKAERSLYIYRDMSPLYDTYDRTISGIWQGVIFYKASLPSIRFSPGDVIPIQLKYRINNSKFRVILCVSYLRELCVYRVPSIEATPGSILREDNKTIELDCYYNEGSLEGRCELKLKIPSNLASFGCVGEYSQFTHKICFRIDYVVNEEHESFVFTMPIFILPSNYHDISPEAQTEDELPTYDIVPPPPSYEAIIPYNYEQQAILV